LALDHGRAVIADLKDDLLLEDTVLVREEIVKLGKMGVQAVRKGKQRPGFAQAVVTLLPRTAPSPSGFAGPGLSYATASEWRKTDGQDLGKQ